MTSCEIVTNTMCVSNLFRVEHSNFFLFSLSSLCLSMMTGYNELGDVLSNDVH